LYITNNKKRNEKGLIFSMIYIMIFSLENIMIISRYIIIDIIIDIFVPTLVKSPLRATDKTHVKTVVCRTV